MENIFIADKFRGIGLNEPFASVTLVLNIMSKLPALPAILMANDLLDGDVLFLGPSAWERSHGKAQIAHGASEAEALLARAARDFKANVIVDPYLVQVAISADGEPVPVHYRERMRTLGPTTRLDLGKQAEA